MAEHRTAPEDTAAVENAELGNAKPQNSAAPKPTVAADKPATDVRLSDAERAFYARQLILPELGMAGQLKLKAATVAVLGAGGLGAPALLYLAGAGVGHIRIIDDDVIDSSNLHRQVIHTYAGVGNSKAESAAESLRALNPFIRVSVVKQRLTAQNATQLLDGAAAVLDGSDNFAARYAVSAAAAAARIPHVWAAVLGFEAQMSVFWAPHGPVYEDLYPVAPATGSVPSCSTAGVVGALTGVVGAAMAMEVIKVIASSGQPLVGEVGLYSALSGRWEYIPLLASMQAKPQESMKSHVQESQEAQNHVIFCHNSVALDTISGTENSADLDPTELKTLLRHQKITLLDVREHVEFEAYAIDSATNFPLTEILAAARTGRLSAKLREKINPHTGCIVVYCTGYTRSVEAVREIASVTNTPVRILRGGISGWLTV